MNYFRIFQLKNKQQKNENSVMMNGNKRKLKDTCDTGCDEHLTMIIWIFLIRIFNK